METRQPGSNALRKGRSSQKQGAYFITIVTRDRIPRFEQPEVAWAVCRSIVNFLPTLGTTNYCWVVMPDHVHLLIGIGDNDLSRLMQRFKAGSALRVNRVLGRRGPFWQRGFFDHGVRREKDLRPLARYIVGNPLRAGLVDNVADYPYWDAMWL